MATALSTDEGAATSRDLDGTDPRHLPVGSGNMSPDGSKVVYSRAEPGVVDGKRGVWRQLCLANADGSGEQVLVEHFVPDSDVVEYWRRRGVEDPDKRKIESIQWGCGPERERWSPKGDRIVFSAVLPFFDPRGAPQSGEWIYELATGILTRLTPDDPSEMVAVRSWSGPNTYPGHPRVTIGSTTVSFSAVTGEGRTTVIRDDDRPAKPGGYRFAGYYYDIRTTAQYRGPVRIGMRREGEDTAGRSGRRLAIERYVEAKGEWEDITTSREGNIVYAVVDSL